MNDYIAEITLDLNCERSCKTVMLTQFDKGKKIHLNVTANGSPYSVSGCSVVMKGVNSDGSRVAVDCEVEQDGTATAVTDDITFAVKGFAAARFVISDSERTYNTQRFLIYIDDALDTDVTSNPNYSILNRLIRQVQLIDEHGGIIVDDELSGTSTHPVQNRVVNAALGEKASAATAFTFDSATTNVTYNENNPKIIYLSAMVDNEKGIVLTSADNYCQYFFGSSKSIKTRNKNGASTYTDWELTAEKAGNKKNSITASNKTSTEYYPSLKAVVDYLAANYENTANKLASDEGIDEDSTDAQYPTAKAVFDFGVQIVDGVNEDIVATNAAVSDLKAYIGYTGGDILGLHCDFENRQFTRLGAAVGLNEGSDFDAFPMYGQRRRVVVDSDGEIQTDMDPAEITETDLDYDVMVYQPKFYYKVVPLKLEKQSDGLGYYIRKANYYVTSTPHAGFKLHPLFCDANGNEVDYVLFSAYEASYMYWHATSQSSGYYDIFRDGVDTDTSIVISGSHPDSIKSLPGVKPVSGKYKTLTKTNAEQLAQNKSANWHIDTIQSISANQLLMAIELGTFNTQTTIGSGIVNIPGNSSYNCTSLTGSTASLGNSSGMASETVNDVNGTETSYSENGKTSVSYRGVENPWGNIWKMVNGINIWGNGSMKGGQPYIAADFNFYESKHDDNYHPAGFSLTNVESSAFISAFGYGNENYDWLFLPSETGANNANSAVPVGDRIYCAGSSLNGYKAPSLGGRWDNSSYAGSFCINYGTTFNYSSVGIGTRLLYVPTANT